jgi:hypothetical protein
MPKRVMAPVDGARQLLQRLWLAGAAMSLDARQRIVSGD